MLPKLSKSRVKQAVKKGLYRSKLKQSKVDALIWLDYLLMMQKLAAAVQDKARSDKTATITAAHIKAVTKAVKKSCKG